MKCKDPLTGRIIGCCFEVHKELGPGFKEKIYHKALTLSFDKEGLRYQTEKVFDVFYLSKRLATSE